MSGRYYLPNKKWDGEKENGIKDNDVKDDEDVHHPKTDLIKTQVALVTNFHFNAFVDTVLSVIKDQIVLWMPDQNGYSRVLMYVKIFCWSEATRGGELPKGKQIWMYLK